jgi:hypothetical protein
MVHRREKQFAPMIPAIRSHLQKRTRHDQSDRAAPKVGR